MSTVPARNSRPSSLQIGSRAAPSDGLEHDLDEAADEVFAPRRTLPEGLLDLLISSNTLSGRNLVGTGSARHATSLGVGRQKREPADSPEARH